MKLKTAAYVAAAMMGVAEVFVSMPRQTRLDSHRTLHHVMMRGI